MKLEVFLSLSEFEEGDAKGKRAVVIDVLRACTTIVYAFKNGAERVIPVSSVEDATRLLPTLDKKATLLGGESEGKKIDGFDLGNSPLEYKRQKVKGKTILMTTTNGTIALVRSKGAKELLAGCFVNFDAVSDRLTSGRLDVAIICAGKKGEFALEDAACAGMLVQKMLEKNTELQLNDGALAALLLAEKYPVVPELLEISSHGKYLISLGFEKDLKICSKLNSAQILPLVEDGRIVPAQKPDSKK
jgi:2-phosphosulfolactate phosphatase